MLLDDIARKVSYLHQHLTLAHRKIGNFIARGVLKLINIDGGGIFNVQGQFLADETISDLQHPQEYGFASKAANGAFIIAMFNGGNRDHGQATTIYDPRYSPRDLAGADTCVYDAADNRVWLKNGGGILIKNGNNIIALNNDGIIIEDKNGNTVLMQSGGITIAAGDGNPVIFNSPVVFNDGFTLNGSSVASGSGSINVGGDISSGGNVSDSVNSMQAMRAAYNPHIHSTPSGNSGAPSTSMG